MNAMRLSLQQKITGSILITFLAAGIAFGTALIPLQNLRTRNALETATDLLRILVDRETEPLANALFEGRVRAIRMRIQDILTLDSMLSITVFDRAGGVVSHIDRLGDHADPFRDSPTTVGGPERIRRGEWHRIPVLVFESPVTAVREPLGHIRIIYSIAQIERERRLSYFLTGAYLIVVLLLMIIVLQFLLSKVVRRPISALRNGIQMIQAEGPGFVVPVLASDEIGELTDAFNRMSLELQALMKQLRIEATERRDAEKALRDSEFRFRTLVHSSPEGIVLLDMDGTVKTANKSLSRITGYDFPEIEGRRFLSFIPESVHATLKKALADLKRGVSQSKPAEMPFRRKDGEEILLSIRGWLVTEEDSRPVAMGAFVRDITREKRLALEKKGLEEQLIRTQKMEAIATLSGGIAHDFNNILGGILGYTELAMVHLGENHPVTERYLIRTLEASKRARDLVQQILRFSRKEAGAMGPVSVKSLFKEAVKLIQSTLPATIRVVERIATEKETVMGDAAQLHQLIMNLCVNAYHAMKTDGGTLTVELSETVVEETRIKHGVECRPGPHLKLSVSDTGIGIAPEVMDRIFDPYFTTKKANEGTGLGLWVSLGVVKTHGGLIEVASTPGAGTCFTVYLPVLAEETTASISEDPIAIPGGHSEKILLVDDEAFFCDVVTETLRGLNYQVTACQSSLHALRVFQSDSDGFDAVITDQTMPEMTGVQLIAEIRRINGRIPVILCTGYSDEVTETSAARYGIAKLIYKPVTREQMGAAVHEVLGDGR